ncbi:hypothetical protein BDZ89DRAFT_1156464 [Hymenopellis radicata]|nr:hypothetical protein BDZ89DRAFT_1156464 [Hymenopellis radicata]
MFTVKATYRGETRKFSQVARSDAAWPLSHVSQLYRVFPHLGHSYYLSRLLFSPDSSEARILIAKEAHNVDEYRRAVSNPSLTGPWPNPMLKFTVFDETPHKAAFSALPAPHTPWAQVPWGIPSPPALGPVDNIALPPSNQYTPQGFVPPPPIIFSPPTATTGISSPWYARSPSPPPTMTPPQQPRNAFNQFYQQPQRIPQTPQRTPCCAVTEAKEDVRNVIDDFKKDLDRIIQSLGPSEAAPLPNGPLASSCALHDCARCGQVFSGPWYSCLGCQTVMCRSCRWSSPLYCGVTTFPHSWYEQKCPRCPVDIVGMPFPPSIFSNVVQTPITPFIPAPPPPPPMHHPPVIPRMNGWNTFPSTHPFNEEAQAPPKVVHMNGWGNPFPSTHPFNEAPPRVNAEAQAPPKVIHTGVTCDSCEATIEGVRHKCLDCPDYDLCSKCIGGGAAERHDPFHEFFDLDEPGRVVVHTIGERDAANFIQAPRSAPAPAPAPVSMNTIPAVHNATCDLCDSRIRGDRYKCVDCPDFDTCGSCFAIVSEQHPRHSFVRMTAPTDLVQSTHKARPVHHASCNICEQTIIGVRYKCMHPTCPDFDLCERCEAHPISVHPGNHPLLKMKAPETVIPTVYRVGTTTLIDVEDRGRPSTRLSTPLSYKSPSRSRSRSPQPLPWFYASHHPEQQRIPGQFPFGLRTPTPPAIPLPPPPMAALSPSPPPLPPKSGIPNFSYLNNAGPVWTPGPNPHNYNLSSKPTYNPSYMSNQSFSARSPSPVPELRSPSPPPPVIRRPPPPPAAEPLYRPVYLENPYLPFVPARPLGPQQAPPALPEVSATRPAWHTAPSRKEKNAASDTAPPAQMVTPAPFPDLTFRQDWAEPSITASPTLTASPAPPAADDLVERAIVQYPPVVPNSSWRSQFQRRLSVDEFEPRNDLVLPEAPKFLPFGRSSPSAKLTTPTKSAIAETAPTVPRLDFSTHISDLASLMMPPFHPPSPVGQEETFLTPISENTQLPLPESELAKQYTQSTNSSTTSYRTHTLAELLNEFPPRSRFSVSDVSRDNQSSEFTRVLETPVGVSTHKVEIATPSEVQGKDIVNSWRAEIEDAPFNADFLEDITVADGQVFPPGAEFVKSWRVKNSGRDWDESTELVFVAGESFKIDLYTGELKAPDAPGRYVGYWRLKNSICHLFGASIWIDITVAEHHNVGSSDPNPPSSMSSSSVIVMPAAPDMRNMTTQMQTLSLSTTAAVTAASRSTSSDVISLDGSEDSFSGASLVSAPSSEDWEEGRVNAPLPASSTPAQGGAPRSNALEYVMLYDDNSSSEEEN